MKRRSFIKTIVATAAAYAASGQKSKGQTLIDKWKSDRTSVLVSHVARAGPNEPKYDHFVSRPGDSDYEMQPAISVGINDGRVTSVAFVGPKIKNVMPYEVFWQRDDKTGEWRPVGSRNADHRICSCNINDEDFCKDCHLCWNCCICDLIDYV